MLLPFLLAALMAEAADPVEWVKAQHNNGDIQHADYRQIKYNSITKSTKYKLGHLRFVCPDTLRMDFEGKNQGDYAEFYPGRMFIRRDGMNLNFKVNKPNDTMYPLYMATMLSFAGNVQDAAAMTNADVTTQITDSTYVFDLKTRKNVGLSGIKEMVLIYSRQTGLLQSLKIVEGSKSWTVWELRE